MWLHSVGVSPGRAGERVCVLQAGLCCSCWLCCAVWRGITARVCHNTNLCVWHDCRYMATFRCCRWTLWVVVPLTILIVALLVMFMEIRVGLQYISTAFGANWQLPNCTLNDCEVFTTNKG